MKNNRNKRKPLIITLIVIAVLAAAALSVWFLWLKDYLAAANASPVYVNPISSIVGLETGATPRYSGIVEPQEIYKINRDESKDVAEIAVQEGDEVHVGDLLFRYSTEEVDLELKSAQYDQEGLSNQITTLQKQKSDLETEKKTAGNDEELAYTVRINAITLQIEQLEIDSDKKKAEMEKLQEFLNNTEVYSEVDGVVKEVNANQTETSGSYSYSDSQSSAFITILSSGEYRIKGTVSELNFSSLSTGQAVIVYSRLDPSITWKGTIDSIDQEAASDQNSIYDGYYYGTDSGEQSSKYNFYVSLENPDGLILGQHVYIEPDLGVTVKKDGIWLPAMYVGHDESGSFVWAKNDSDKLEKRIVILGDYDTETDSYQIKSGVTKTDCIAYPTEDLLPGMPTTMDAQYQQDYMDMPDTTTNVGGADLADKAFSTESGEGYTE